MNILWSMMMLVLAMQAAAPSPVRVVSRDAMSMVEEPKQAVARTASEWATLWRQHAGDTPLPKVDLNSRTVVAVFLGTRSSAGYTADITAVREATGALIVEWQEHRPKPGETCRPRSSRARRSSPPFPSLAARSASNRWDVDRFPLRGGYGGHFDEHRR